MGVQNQTGYVGYAVPGRNGTSWSAYGEGWRYTPTSVDSFQIAPVAYNLEPIVPGEKITYEWFLDDELIATTPGLTVTPAVTTTYWARATLCDGQEFTDSVTVYVIPYIPNAFTPNGDGLNDTFRILGLPNQNITLFNLQIFNRWGEIVFHSTDVQQGWDGRLKGELCPEGTYVWVIFYEDGSKIRQTNRGQIMLVR
jgi:gliding motility-associated-like protein